MAGQKKVFIISAMKQLQGARLLASEVSCRIKNHPIELVVWRSYFQQPKSHNKSMWDIVKEAISESTHAIVFLSGDDWLERVDSQGNVERFLTTRDNVLIELGAFVQKLGLSNVFFLIDASNKYKMPSDFIGRNKETVTFDNDFPKEENITQIVKWLVQNEDVRLDDETDIQIGTPEDTTVSVLPSFSAKQEVLRLQLEIPGVSYSSKSHDTAKYKIIDDKNENRDMKP